VITDRQQRLIDALAPALSNDVRIESAWLAGSLGKRSGDAFSDVDVLVVVPDGELQPVLDSYRANMASIIDVVRVNLVRARVLNCITENWERFDITFVKPAEFAARPFEHMTALFNRGTPEREAPAPSTYKTSPERILELVNEFIRVLGLLPVAIGREEYVLAEDGIGLLRRMTIDLMIEQNGIAPSARGGALHLHRLLTSGQHALLSALPPVSATRDSALAGHQALARLFLPLAREMAAQSGAVWPSTFEEATRRHLARTIGMEI
jgi:predicted nucleotidyltransferase